MASWGERLRVLRPWRWHNVVFWVILSTPGFSCLASLQAVCVLSRFSPVWFFVILWTVARQAPLSMGFSRQEYWSGLPCPPPGDLPDPGIEPISLMSPALVGRFFTTSTTWKSPVQVTYKLKHNNQVASPHCIMQMSTKVSCLFPFLMKLAQTTFSMWLSLHIFAISPGSLGSHWACTGFSGPIFSSNIPTWNMSEIMGIFPPR